MLVKNKKIIKKIKKLKLNISLKSQDFLLGEHRSLFRGSGLEFNNLRKYVVGDDIKRIDWKATAKNNQLFVKEFQEERELSFFIFLDISASMGFSSQLTSKHEMALELIGSLIFFILKNNDRLGLILFSDEIEDYLPSRKGIIHYNQILNCLLTHPIKKKKTNLKKMLNFFSLKQRKKSFIFFFSDFLFPANELLAFKNFNRKHKILAFHLQDKIEANLPNLGLIDFEDSETGESLVVDTSAKFFQKEYNDGYQKHLQSITKQLQQLKIKKLDLFNHKNYLKKMYIFLKQHG